MATGALASLLLGNLLDKVGLPILLAAFGVSDFFAPLVFLRGTKLELVGMILWGIGMGAQDSCLKAVLSTAVPPERRSTAFGIFDTGFGIAWFVGSVSMGLLYDRSIPALVLFSVLLQLLALPVLALDVLLTGRRVGRMHLVCYLRRGEEVFETYWTTGRGVEVMDNSYRLLDLTAYGRQEMW
jgi:MFS-type transporter involved in bile tolerance (Atg22 family)